MLLRYFKGPEGGRGNTEWLESGEGEKETPRTVSQELLTKTE